MEVLHLVSSPQTVVCTVVTHLLRVPLLSRLHTTVKLLRLEDMRTGRDGQGLTAVAETMVEVQCLPTNTNQVN